MEVIEVRWMNSRTTVGAILAKNEIGELHVYIGAVDGYDQDADIKSILDYGCKMTPEVWKSTFNKHI